MLARLNTSEKGQELPSEWKEFVEQVLNDSFLSECQKLSGKFQLFGEVFPEEFLVMASFLSENEAAPLTCFLSAEKDQIDTPKKLKKTQEDFLKLFGHLFDEAFAKGDDDTIYEPVWQDVTLKSEKYFFKLSRENIALTIEANRLLQNH